MINLYEYITSHDIIDNITTSCTIISDTVLTKTISSHISYVPLSDIFKKDFSKSTDACIVITEHLNSNDYKSLQGYLPSGVSWINLNPGVMSMITKNNPEINDIVNMLGQHYTVVEPLDIKHLHSSLQPNTYIRIHDIFLPETLSSYSRKDGFTKSINSDRHSDYVILTTPAHIDSVSATLHTLSQNPDFLIDFYIQHTFSTILSQELIEDIQRTQHIIIIIDHKATEELWMYYDTLIRQQTGLKEVTIQYIFPQYHLVSSILPEYLYEESQFDQPNFLQYISSYTEYTQE